jgi:MFS family permease
MATRLEQLHAAPVGRAGWWLVAAMALTTYLAMLDSTVVAVALPTITEDFNVTPALSEWLVLAYLLPLVGLSLPAGRWLDSAPWRECLLVSATGFAAASVMVALSPGAGWAIASRGLQGVFAAVLFAAAPAVASAAVAPSSRGRAMSALATVGPLGAMSGYAAGAFVVDNVGWPWVFYLNVPVVAGVAVIVLSVMPAESQRFSMPATDGITEAATLLLASGALLGGLAMAASRDLSWLVLSLMAGLPFAAWARSGPGRQTVSKLRVPRVARPHLSLLLESTAFGGVGFALPFMLENSDGTSTWGVGTVLVALPAASVVGSMGGGWLTDLWTARHSAMCGLGVLASGLTVIALTDGTGGPSGFLWGIALAGAGAGCFSGSNQALAMSMAAPEEAASTGASTSVARQLGFALGPAIATTVWAQHHYEAAGLFLFVGFATACSVVAGLVLAGRPTSWNDAAPRKETR